MQITDVKVFLVGEEKLRAFVSIVLDGSFMVNDIKVIQGRDGLFISMPSRKKRNGQFKDVAHPLNQETRDWMEEEILGEYERCLADEGPEQTTSLPPTADSQPPRVPIGGQAPAAAAIAAASGGPSPRSESSGDQATSPDPPGQVPPGRAAEPEPAGASAMDLEEGRSLDEIQRRHLSDSFWNVS